MQHISKTVYCDVAVIGGGVGGCAAAIEASRKGMRTILFEKGVSLGGLATNGYVPSVAGGIEGICLEFVKRLDEMGQVKKVPGQDYYHNPVFEPEYGKIVLEDLLWESGSRIQFDSTLIDTVVEDNKITAAIFYTKGGYVEVQAKMYIDATGDGDVAALSGVPFEVGGQEFGGLNIASTLGTRWAGANLVKYQEAENAWKKEQAEKGNTNPGHYIMELEKQAIEAGELARTVGGPSGFFKLTLPNTPEDNADFVTFAFHTYYCHNTDAADITRQVLEQRQLIKQFHAFLKKYVPGYENVRLIGMGNLPGVRESRRIFGEYMLKSTDVAFGNKFEDGIARFPEMYDTHHPTSEDWFFQRHIHVPEVQGTAIPEENEKGIHCDARMHPFGTPKGIPVRPSPKDYCEIPYRCLLPEKIDNLLCAGRCCSAEFHANGAMRIIGPAMGTGHAAGLAAAKAVKEHVRPRDIDGKEIRRLLIEEGVNLDEPCDGHWQKIREAEGEFTIGASDAISFRPTKK